jgi:hypothetical protein
MPHNPVSLPEGLSTEHSGLNRRACIRYRCTRPIPRRMAIAESFASLDGWLTDISVIGLGLLLDRALDAGTLLYVELESSPEAAPVELLAHVVQNTATPEGDWLIGCEFVNRLDEADLRALLR